MGILARKQGTEYVVTSDRNVNDAPTNRAPKSLSDSYEVWTGAKWSIDIKLPSRKSSRLMVRLMISRSHPMPMWRSRQR